ncbi:MAG TPA: flagellar basal body-associated FliL family protein [Spirochaetota bacterium]|nr:flagellar basal body-associated FliL family protein [Spirochaetota bacterium]HOM38701.1 flagellar basal body-associated FliL family protein [Spirochaetota bacterium]HPQ49783.1 flagellar basal body-associated FliL family protein [Spirochaetota bacterium]
MEENKENQVETIEETENKGFLKKILKTLTKLLVLILFVLMIIFVARLVISSKQEKEENINTGIKEFKEQPVVKKEPLLTKKLKRMNFNLSDPKGKSSVFFSVEIVLGYMNPDPIFNNELTKRELEIIDIVRGVITRKTYNNIEGPENIKVIKEEILTKINNVLKYGKIDSIMFSEYNLIPKE